MGPIGVPEMIAIFLVALLLFGPKKLPELGRNIGKAITEFRRASNELKATFESHLSELDKENQELKNTLSPYTNFDYDNSSSSSSYDSEYQYGSDYSQSSGSSETSASQPTTAGATAIQDAQATGNEAKANVTPQVAGTVPRSSNYGSDAHNASAEESHPA